MNFFKPTRIPDFIYDHLTSFFDKLENRFSYCFLLCLLFSSILYLNIQTPFIGDDFVYSFIFRSTERIENIHDIIESQIIHYNSWGGRTVVHFILQCLLLIKSPFIINILNASVFILFLTVIQFHFIGYLRVNTISTFIIFSLTCILQPAFAETCLWLTGSINYLWGTTIILYFLLPYRLYKGKMIRKDKSFIFSILMFFAGIITGWTNENTIMGLIIIIIGLIYYHLKLEKNKIPVWFYFGLVGIIIGYILMIIAPGNFVRASEAGTPNLMVFAFRFFTATEALVSYLSLLNLGLIISIILLLKFSNDSKNKSLIIISIIYLLGVFASIYSMIASPTFPPRAWFGTITFNIIAFGIIFSNLNFGLKFLNAIKICFIFYCLFNLLFMFYDAVKDTREINSIWKNRITEIQKAKLNNVKDISFKKYNAKTKFGMSDAYYADSFVSDYYGINFKTED